MHHYSHLPRLDHSFYRGWAYVHWTMTIDDRKTGWLNATFHRIFREMMLHASAREGLICPVYCLMPDHLHFLWMGLGIDSDQRNGCKFLRTQLNRALAPYALQEEPCDHVLREHERERGAFGSVCYYIAENPQRAGLVESALDWQYSGCIIPGYPTLHPYAPDFWEKFWKIYISKRSSPPS